MKAWQTSYTIVFYQLGEVLLMGKVEAFAVSALALLLPSGVLDIRDEESPWMIP